MAICPLKCLISFHVFLSPSIVRVSSISARLVLDNPNKGVSKSKGIEGSHSPPHRPLKGRRRSVSGKKNVLVSYSLRNSGGRELAIKGERTRTVEMADLVGGDLALF